MTHCSSKGPIDMVPLKSSMESAGLRPNMRCPSCDTYVNEAGLHFQDKLTTFIVGESTLLWQKASEALEKVRTSAALISVPYQSHDQAMSKPGCAELICHSMTTYRIGLES